MGDTARNKRDEPEIPKVNLRGQKRKTENPFDYTNNKRAENVAHPKDQLLAEEKQLVVKFGNKLGKTGKVKGGNQNRKQTERYENRFKTEEERRDSFSNWPNEGSPSPAELARAGFEHTPYEGGPDCVYCEHCKKYVEDWEPGDEPQKEHKKRCPFYKKGKQQKQNKNKGCEKDSTPAPQQSLSLIVESAINSGFNNIEKVIHDKFDELKREIKETKGSCCQLSEEDIDDIINKYDSTDESEEQNRVAEIQGPSIENTGVSEQQGLGFQEELGQNSQSQTRQNINIGNTD